MKAWRLKKIPPLRSDAAAERFVAQADLTEYDLSEFQPMRFEIQPTSAFPDMRGPRGRPDA